MNNKMKRKWEILISICILLLTPVISTLMAFFVTGKPDFVLRSAAISFAASMFCVYATELTRIKKLFYLGNEAKQGCFLLLYFAGVILAAVSGMRSPYILPISFIAVMTMLYSGFMMGVSALFSYSLLVCMMSSQHTGCFVYVFSIGFIALLLFYKPEKPLNFISKSVSVLAVGIMLFFALEIIPDYRLEPGKIIDALAGLLISFVLLIFVLRIYSQKYLETYDLIYEGLNDPENPLLMRLKNELKEEYFIAIHTAYLSDKICKKMNRDNVACKCAGYYHRIGVLNKGPVGEKTLEIVKDEAFPPKALAIIQDYHECAGKPLHSETAICMLANDIVSSIRYMANARKTVDYDQIIDFIFKKRFDAGIYENTDFKISEIRVMKEMFKGEKLYYDFLH